MASKLIVNEIEHTDGAGTAVTMAKATIADATATLTAGTLGSGVTGGSGLTALGTVTEGDISHADIVYPSGHVVNIMHYTNNTRRTSNEVSSGDFWTVTYTKLLAGTKLLVYVGVPLHGPSNGNSGEYITIGGTQYGSITYNYGGMAQYGNACEMMNGMAEKTGQAAGSVTIGWGCDTSAGGSIAEVINPNSTDDSRNQQKVSTITVWEIMV